MGGVVPCQDLPCRPTDVPAGRASLCRRDRCRLSLQNRLVPGPNAFWGPPHVHCAGDVATIVAEYNTQVQHDQLIFPQSFGGGARMRQGGSLSKCDDRFKCRSRHTFLSHLIFDLAPPPLPRLCSCPTVTWEGSNPTRRNLESFKNWPTDSNSEPFCWRMRIP